MSKIITILIYFISIIILSCSQRKMTIENCFSVKPVEDVALNKGVDYAVYKVFKKDIKNNFVHYVNTLESSDFLKGYSRVEFIYRVELLDDPKSVLFKSTELERISYRNPKSKNRYILVHYPDYILVCILRV